MRALLSLVLLGSLLATTACLGGQTGTPTADRGPDAHPSDASCPPPEATDAGGTRLSGAQQILEQFAGHYTFVGTSRTFEGVTAPATLELEVRAREGTARSATSCFVVLPVEVAVSADELSVDVVMEGELVYEDDVRKELVRTKGDYAWVIATGDRDGRPLPEDDPRLAPLFVSARLHRGEAHVELIVRHEHGSVRFVSADVNDHASDAMTSSQ